MLSIALLCYGQGSRVLCGCHMHVQIGNPYHILFSWHCGCAKKVFFQISTIPNLMLIFYTGFKLMPTLELASCGYEQSVLVGCFLLL